MQPSILELSDAHRHRVELALEAGEDVLWAAAPAGTRFFFEKMLALLPGAVITGLPLGELLRALHTPLESGEPNIDAMLLAGAWSLPGIALCTLVLGWTRRFDGIIYARTNRRLLVFSSNGCLSFFAPRIRHAEVRARSDGSGDVILRVATIRGIEETVGLLGIAEVQASATLICAVQTDPALLADARAVAEWERVEAEERRAATRRLWR